MKKVVKYLIILIVIFMFPILVSAHPGRTDSKGCHTCRTNCESWGLSYGQYHCHNGSGSSRNSKSYNTTKKTTTTRRVYGCTDSNAINYNSNANMSDGSCNYEKIETVSEKIYYNTEIKGKLTSGKKEVIREGKDGKKEVTIKKIVDEDGNIISSEKINETITEEPVNEIIEYHITTKKVKTKEKEVKKESNNAPLIVTIILLILNAFYGYKNKDANMIINKIKSVNSHGKYILYFLYFIFVIPVFIDIILVIIDLFKKSEQS